MKDLKSIEDENGDVLGKIPKKGKKNTGKAKEFSNNREKSEKILEEELDYIEPQNSNSNPDSGSNSDLIRTDNGVPKTSEKKRQKL